MSTMALRNLILTKQWIQAGFNETDINMRKKNWLSEKVHVGKVKINNRLTLKLKVMYGKQ